MRRKRILFILLLLAVAVTACGSGGRQDGDDSTAVTAAVRELPVPVVPDSLVTPGERAAYAAVHFWDAMDFGNPAMAGDSALVEQSFSNFIALLPYADAHARQRAVTKLLDHAAAGAPGAYSMVMSVADHYLWDAESPFYSEDLYLPFVDYALARDGNDVVSADRRAVIMKNRPGSKAPDFAVRTRDGRTVSLRDYGAGVTTLLMFYEPDCDRCHAAIESMTADPALNDAVAAGRLRLLAVYVGDDTGAWAEHAAILPGAWQVAIDSRGRIDSDDLYTIRATPSFYLIDASGTIVLKDAPLQQILAAAVMDGAAR